MEVKFIHQRLEEEALKRRIQVSLNGKWISPIELQIAFKLFLGSEKDIEDARHLHNIFKEHLNKDTLRYYINELHQEEKRKYLDMKALERWKQKNQRERLEFIDEYAAWLKKTPNKEWSRQQKELFE